MKIIFADCSTESSVAIHHNPVDLVIHPKQNNKGMSLVQKCTKCDKKLYTHLNSSSICKECFEKEKGKKI